MSSLCSFLMRALRALPALLALLLLAAGLPARAADENDPGGTFSTPTYPPRSTTPSGTNPIPQGTVPGTQPPGSNGRGAGTGANGDLDNGTTRGRTGGDNLPRRTEPAPPPKPNEFQRFV